MKKEKMWTIVLNILTVVGLVFFFAMANKKQEKEEESESKIVAEGFYNNTAKEVAEGIYVVPVSETENIIAIRSNGEYKYLRQIQQTRTPCLILHRNDGAIE